MSDFKPVLMHDVLNGAHSKNCEFSKKDIFSQEKYPIRWKERKNLNNLVFFFNIYYEFQPFYVHVENQMFHPSTENNLFD